MKYIFLKPFSLVRPVFKQGKRGLGAELMDEGEELSLRTEDSKALRSCAGTYDKLRP